MNESAIKCPVPKSVAIVLAVPDEKNVPDSGTIAIIEPRARVTAVTHCGEGLSSESYRLEFDSCIAHIEAADYRGCIYALQSLSQLLDADSVPLKMSIIDKPRCSWRAFMLDSGRQYQSVSTIKKYLRLMSMMKMNRFHWHLTEGLGWRVEIDAFPQLCLTGGYVASGPEQQGYYSKTDISEIVNYAARLGIEIVPEIDIPGHSEAALYAYPHLGCRGEKPQIPEQGFTSDIFCAGSDSTVAALKIILDEVCSMFPGEYIHLGGDEAPKANWDKCSRCRRRIEENNLTDTHDLQLWLSAEMALHLASKGRKAIFWDDVLVHPGTVPLPGNTVVQWWNFRSRGFAPAVTACKHNIPLILSPNYYCYLNFPEEPWRGYDCDRTFDFRKAYQHNPADSVMNLVDQNVLGITAALWTDYGLTENMLDYRLMPRIFAIAELMWHNGEKLPLEYLLKRSLSAQAHFSRKENLTR